MTRTYGLLAVYYFCSTMRVGYSGSPSGGLEGLFGSHFFHLTNLRILLDQVSNLFCRAGVRLT